MNIEPQWLVDAMKYGSETTISYARAEFIADMLRSMDEIRLKVESAKQRLQSEKDRHVRETAVLLDELETVRSKCQHLSVIHHHPCTAEDDAHDECCVCGKIV